MDAIGLCTLLDGFLLGKHIVGIQSSLRYLETRRVVLQTQKQYNIALRACVRARKIVLFWAVLQEMNEAGVPKNEITYTQMLFARMFENNTKAVNQILNEIDEKNLVLWSRNLYFALIEFFRRARSYQSLDRISDLLIRNSLLTSQTRSALLRHYKERADSTRYKTIWKALPQDNI
jgi:pentatricopeptide repeat protein